MVEESAAHKYLTVEYPKALGWYDDRAKASKRWYRGLSLYVLAVSAALTFVVAMGAEKNAWRWIGSFASVTIVIAAGLLAHLKCHENWLSFRATWDALERERRKYETGTGEYEGVPDKHLVFVQRVESILAREGADFYGRHAKGEVQAKEPEPGT